jgi:thioredoxin-related protein
MALNYYNIIIYYNYGGFMKRFLSVLFMTCSFSYGLQLNEDPSFLDIYENGDNDQKNVLLFYSAKTCPQCAYMKQKVFQEANVKQYLQKHLVVLEKDINKDELPKGFEYFGIPTMFFVNKDGKQVGKIVGSLRAEPFLKTLKNILEKGE